MLIYPDDEVMDDRLSALRSRQPVSPEVLEKVIQDALGVVGDQQQEDGYWDFELATDAGTSADYVLLEHYLGRVDPERQQRIAVHLRRLQGHHGGWSLYHGGGFNLSSSVKAYFALKLMGDDPDTPHMRRARVAIIDHGGAARVNVFTRFQLALFGQVPWQAVPVMPVEVMLLPQSALFSIWNISCWSRTVMVPLMVLGALRPEAVKLCGDGVRELFVRNPAKVTDWLRSGDHSAWAQLFRRGDRILRPLVSRIPGKLHRQAIRAALDFIEPRLGPEGLGGTCSASSAALVMYRALGVADDDPRVRTLWQALQTLLVTRKNETHCQPFMTSARDTALSGLAVLEASVTLSEDARADTMRALQKSARWLRDRQILEKRGDWAVHAPAARPGGWAFQGRNEYYPDLDDTALIGMLLQRLDPLASRDAVEHAREWILGMQVADGGWETFDASNAHDLLDHVPFAEQGLLQDEPVADVTARCISFLCQAGDPDDRHAIGKALVFLRAAQQPEGCWSGRWGVNYIYGTWTVLCALNVAGVPHSDPMVKRAVTWLEDVQRQDGGWGEDCESYEGGSAGVFRQSIPSQTAWALLALMATGQRDSEATRRGVSYLVSSRNRTGVWEEDHSTAVIVPRRSYLRHDGYRQFFPLMALARYRNLTVNQSDYVEYGY
ncbi:squalene--hopene cyclase [Gluconobacter morbifer]|uniref:Squalene-hopene cyclase n=1 Tax=Gluconobacter morbifer G707 TaxID=1088869 RepID=G6XHR5_9PROT|nr:squalene--hopene cyclase [Gluconobacter morbifer]EHH68289.1 squalene-hopene cyclase [Gluconobacter morbifer G707]